MRRETTAAHSAFLEALTDPADLPRPDEVQQQRAFWSVESAAEPMAVVLPLRPRRTAVPHFTEMDPRT